ncbi:MAG: HAD-IIB family hydrolase [Deltaproteobacteria bacterium]|jgi:HAD superfamily hydrolase (TIGR01484 family)|nr:HAD-IIB family hydrolase [Deltaproteobacteria bacterium]
MSLSVAELGGPVRALFSDLDGTLTTDGRIEAETYGALEELDALGIPVIIVTGRPAGWGQALAQLTAASAVVTENGGVTFVREGNGWSRLYGVPAASLPEWRRKMRAAAVDAMTDIGGARLSSDSKYREVDLAIDWNEECSLAPQDAEHIVSMLRERGFTAVRSSVHVNFGPPKFDKFSACKEVVEMVLGGSASELGDYVYVGDALNDAPMFGGFEKSVGVGNVRQWWDQLPAKPKFVTESDEGHGFRELVARIKQLAG